MNYGTKGCYTAHVVQEKWLRIGLESVDSASKALEDYFFLLGNLEKTFQVKAEQNRSVEQPEQPEPE